jgi:hypothetical protein
MVIAAADGDQVHDRQAESSDKYRMATSHRKSFENILYHQRNFFLTSFDGRSDPFITGKAASDLSLGRLVLPLDED